MALAAARAWKTPMLVMSGESIGYGKAISIPDRSGIETSAWWVASNGCSGQW